jgi:hypothetical protein
MRSNFKLVVLLSSFFASTALFAQSTPPSQSPGAKPSTVKPAQTAQDKANGSQAAGAATAQTGAEPAGLAGLGIPAAVAAGLIAVGAAVANDNGSSSAASPSHH